MVYFLLKNKLGYLVLIISLIVSFVVLGSSKHAPEGFQFLWILPLVYGVLFFCTNIKYAVIEYVGIAFLNFILLGRYLILPLFTALKGQFFHSYSMQTDPEANALALLAMAYEMICVFVALHFLIKKLDNAKNNRSSQIFYAENKSDIYLLVLFVGLLSFILLPSIRERTNFLIPSGFTYYNLNTLSSIAYLFAANSIPVLFLMAVRNSYIRSINNRNIRQIPLLLIALVNISIFYGPGRMSVLAQGIATVVLLGSLHITSRKSIYLIVSFTLLIVLSLTSFRWFGAGDLAILYYNADTYLSNQTTSNLLQAYFGGPHLISIAVTSHSKFLPNAGLHTFLNEILSSIIFVRQVFPPLSDLSTVFFNRLFGYTEYNSMIVPTLGQSYMYFGFVGAPILSILFCYLLFQAELRAINSTSIGERYAFLLLAVWLALFPMQNLGIVTQTIFNKFLPLFLIVKANQRFVIWANVRKS